MVKSQFGDKKWKLKLFIDLQTSITFVLWLLQICGICSINRGVHVYVWISGVH